MLIACRLYVKVFRMSVKYTQAEAGCMLEF